MNFFHKGGGSTGFHISYSEMLGLKITHVKTINFYSSKGSFSHILGVHCTNIRGAIKNNFRKNLGFWPNKGGGHTGPLGGG